MLTVQKVADLEAEIETLTGELREKKAELKMLQETLL